MRRGPGYGGMRTTAGCSGHRAGRPLPPQRGEERREPPEAGAGLSERVWEEKKPRHPQGCCQACSPVLPVLPVQTLPGMRGSHRSSTGLTGGVLGGCLGGSHRGVLGGVLARDAVGGQCRAGGHRSPGQEPADASIPGSSGPGSGLLRLLKHRAWVGGAPGGRGTRSACREPRL